MPFRIMSDADLTKFEILRDGDHEFIAVSAAARILHVSERHMRILQTPKKGSLLFGRPPTRSYPGRPLAKSWSGPPSVRPAPDYTRRGEGPPHLPRPPVGLESSNRPATVSPKKVFAKSCSNWCLNPER